MRLAILMDPFAAVHPKKDTTVAFIKRALALGWQCVAFTLKEMVCVQGRVSISGSVITQVNESASNWITYQPQAFSDLSLFDIVLMRKDPPVDIEYMYATYALTLAEQKGVCVSNKPQSLRDMNEKYAIMQFPECCVPTLISSSILQLKAFWESHRKVIFKPLGGMGGESVFFVDDTGKNLSVILEILTQREHFSIMAQVYIPEIQSAGDKRVLIVGGKPIPYALSRMPQAGEHRGNLAAGGSGHVVPLTARDYWICEQLIPTVNAKGLHFVGIDIIGDYLTEINITSPTCLKEIEAETKLDIAGMYLEYLANACSPSSFAV